MEVRAVSDHNPVILDSNPPNWGPSPFRFENMWLDYKDFDKVLKNGGRSVWFKDGKDINFCQG